LKSPLSSFSFLFSLVVAKKVEFNIAQSNVRVQLKQNWANIVFPINAKRKSFPRTYRKIIGTYLTTYLLLEFIWKEEVCLLGILFEVGNRKGTQKFFAVLLLLLWVILF
jgi:hypothetical protein